MTHSHMPVMHLIKQVELYKAKRQLRDNRPLWLIEMIDRMTDLFEPMADYGRVGFDCQYEEEHWTVSLFLGQTEYIGGESDGLSRPMNFQFNVLSLMELFDETHRLDYVACPDVENQTELNVDSHITLLGRINENHVRLHVLSTSPEGAGPGIRQFPNGEIDAV